MDYAHARHAGNLGDVLKHVALVAVCQELSRELAPLLYLESHAGDGRYPLGSNGEWGEGIARLWDRPESAGPLGVYRKLVGRFSTAGASRPLGYPGSPLIAQALLPKSAKLLLFELDPQSAGVLRTALGADERALVRNEEGLAGLARELAAAGKAQRALVLVDPPYSEKAEWAEVARRLPELYREHPEASFLLWYPIKAMTRPAALLGALAEAGLRGTAVELVGTPLRLKREKLNGCGVALLRCPPAALSALCADLPELGARLQTRGEWTCRLFGF